jgi:uncharacterized protein
MKYLLVLLVVAIGLFALFGRGRGRRPAAPDKAEPARPPAPAAAAPAPMLACAHCGVHLPRDDAVLDAAGRGFCGDAHRLAGPR